MDPHSFSDYCTQAFYDELRDEPFTVPDTRAASASGTSRSAPGFSDPHPSRVAGGPAHLEIASPVPNPVTRGGRTADASATSGRRGANLRCVCGQRSWRDCPGGGVFTTCTLDLNEEAPAVVTSDPGAMAA
jgi:hypothetical protein